MRTNVVVLGIVATGLVSVPVSTITAAADCVIYGSVDKEFAEASAVFEARVTAVEWIPGRECCHVVSGSASLETDRWWKGEPVRTIKISAAGQIFEIGKRYVVFGFGTPPIADGCNRTRPIEESVKTLEWLAKKPNRRASRAPEMGTWRRSNGTFALGELKVIPGRDNAEFELEVSRGAPSYNSGIAAGRMVLENGRWSWETREHDGLCRLVFAFEQRLVRIAQVGDSGDCGFGYGVMADGDYALISHDKPKFREKR